MFRLLLCAMSLLALASAPYGARSAAPAVGSCGSCQIYLPLIARPLPTPQLSAPANGSQIGTLAPELSWTQLITGTYLIQVSADPSFTTTVVSATTDLKAPLPAQATYIVGSNLGAATLFYWRVGLLQPGKSLFSPAWGFTTPAKDPALLPPPPQLLAPPDHTTLITEEVTLSWQGVSGALYYRIRVLNPDGTTFKSVTRGASTTTYSVAGLAPATTYTWQARVLNPYGWGSYGTSWSFTTP